MIYVLLADGFEEIEALTPVDILRRAGLALKTVGITGKTVCSAHGIVVEADILPEEANENIDLLILPGGMPGAANLDASPAAMALLQRAVEEKSLLAAICAAPFILGKRGLLHGKRFTCFPGFEDGLDGIHCPSERVVHDGKVITAVGMGAAAEFSLTLLSALGMAQEAENIATAAFVHA